MGVTQGPGRRAGPEVAEQPRGHRHPQQDGHAERDQEPPGVAAEPPVERPRDDESGQGRRVAQLVHAVQPRRVVRRLVDQVVPVATGAGADARLGVGRGHGGFDGRVVDVGTGLDPDHPLAGAGLHVEVDGSEVLDAGLRQAGHDVRGAVHVAPEPACDGVGLVGPALAEDAAVVDAQEAEERPGQARVGVDGPSGRAEGVVAPGQVEQVPGDDEDAGPVPGVEGPGELGGQCQRRRRGPRGEQQVAHDHDPAPEGDVDPGAARVGVEGVGAGTDGIEVGGLEIDGVRFDGDGSRPRRVLVLGVGGRGHGPASLKACQR